MNVHTYSYQLQPEKVRAEFFRLLPISLFVVAFGAAFGLAAIQKGLEPLQAILMSTTVFAGASQFAAVDMWGSEVSLIPLMAVVFAINSRHLLMGASLYPMLRDVSPGRRYGLLLLLTDANWAVSAQEYQSGKRNLEVILGGGLVLWVAWIIGTWLGVYFGGLLQNPKSLGLDMVLGCFLLATRRQKIPPNPCGLDRRGNLIAGRLEMATAQYPRGCRCVGRWRYWFFLDGKED